MSDSARDIIGLYERHAAEWAARRIDCGIERGWLERFAALLPHGAAVLDLGCGSGEPIARWLIGRGFSVTGLDSSPSLIARCRETFPAGRWVVGDMREIDLGRRFDGIIAWHSSFHLTREDQRALFPRLARHLRPGGVLMFTSGPEEGERIGAWMGEPLHHASLSPDEYRTLLAASGLEVVNVAFADSECGGATVWLAQAQSVSRR